MKAYAKVVKRIAKPMYLILMLLGICLFGLSTFTSIGVGIYMVGPGDMALGGAMWEGFKTFLIMNITGAVCWLLGSVFGELSDIK